jgi:hypothetical protein
MASLLGKMGDEWQAMLAAGLNSREMLYGLSVINSNLSQWSARVVDEDCTGKTELTSWADEVAVLAQRSAAGDVFLEDADFHRASQAGQDLARVLKRPTAIDWHFAESAG